MLPTRVSDTETDKDKWSSFFNAWLKVLDFHRPAWHPVSPGYGCYGNYKHCVGACTVVMGTGAWSKQDWVYGHSGRVTGEVTTLGLYLTVQLKIASVFVDVAYFRSSVCACLIAVIYGRELKRENVDLFPKYTGYFRFCACLCTVCTACLPVCAWVTLCQCEAMTASVSSVQI